MHLGKKSAKHDSRTLKLASYLDLGRIEIDPRSYVNWYEKLKELYGLPLFGNDALGDCVLASRAHGLQVASLAESGLPTDILTSEVIADYRDVGGYAGTPATDNGAYMLDSLNNWRNKGMRGAGKRHKILAFASVNVHDKEELRVANQLFGGIYCGFDLPRYVRGVSDPWTWYKSKGVQGDFEPGSWGGHAVWLARASEAKLGFVTWGREQICNHGFVQTYCDEAYVVLQNDWALDGKAPSGFDLEQLLADVRARGGS